MAYDPYANREARLGRVADVTRRQFLLIIGAIGSLGALLFGGIMSLKFMFPGAPNEAPAEFKVDADPNSITVGSPLQITDKRVSLVRDDAGFYAVYLVCTHLGCTPNYSSDVTFDQPQGVKERAKAAGQRSDQEKTTNGWACPCHGSRYFIDSTNFFGPAPRPMDWVKVSLVNGKLVVDRGTIVVQRGAGQTTTPTWRLKPDGSVVGKTIP